MNSTGVIIARFQTPYLHEGHRYMLEQTRAKHHKVVIVLGVSPVKGTKRNPFDFYTREKLIKAAYPDFVVLPLADHPSNTAWSLKLDELLLQCFPNEEFVLYGGRDSFVPFYSGRMPVAELAEQSDHSSTVIRDEYSDRVLNSEDFRLGVNYACHNMYSKVYPTVDIAVFRDDKKYLLLGRKKQRKAWQLPGGFVDVTDCDFESAAKRELLEECGSIEVTNMFYVGSAKIDDWRYRNEEDKIITMLFATDLVFGQATANDDLNEVEWIGINALDDMIRNEMIVPEHVILVDLLLKSIRKENKLQTQSI
jgi:bifunctional NMN adenylyltransferase/nudix hydrolase